MPDPAQLSASGLFLAIAGAHLLAVASPGPDFALVLRASLARGRPAGVASALGIGSGIVGHCAVAFLGLGWLVRAVPGVTLALTLGGAALLAWIGLSALRAPWPVAGAAEGAPAMAPPTRVAASDARRALGRDYRNGLLTNLLNGKALLFFVTLGSVALAHRPPWWVVAGLFLWLPLATAGWFCGVAWLVGHPRLQRRLVRAAPWLDKAMGLILVALAVGLLAGLAGRGSQADPGGSAGRSPQAAGAARA